MTLNYRVADSFVSSHITMKDYRYELGIELFFEKPCPAVEATNLKPVLRNNYISC